MDLGKVLGGAGSSSENNIKESSSSAFNKVSRPKRKKQKISISKANSKRRFKDPGSPLPPKVKKRVLDDNSPNERHFRNNLLSRFSSMDSEFDLEGETEENNNNSSSSTNFDNENNKLSFDLRKMSRNDLEAKIIELDRKLKLAQDGNQLSSPGGKVPKQKAQLSPAIHSVQSHHAVRKTRLGRCSSFSTQEKLRKITVPTSNAFVDKMLNMFRPGGHPREYFSSLGFANNFITLCSKVGQVLEKEPRVIDIQSPVYVFGDIHGNFDDLKWFSEHVWPLGMRLTAGTFLFLGDFVDRGDYGIEILAYLFAMKLQQNTKLYMLRGNHETRAVNGWEEYYKERSFLAQCKNRFGEKKGECVWEIANRVFDRMPLASIIDNSIFCVHGGIPKPLNPSYGGRVQAIRNLPCPIDVQPPIEDHTTPSNDLAFTLLWADPASPQQEHFGMLDSKSGFGESQRGGGTIIFGTKAVEQFLQKNNFTFIVRAHEATQMGVNVTKNAKVLTVFSTSKDHGCGMDARCGCLLVDGEKLLAINRSSQYSATPRPTVNNSHADLYGKLSSSHTSKRPRSISEEVTDEINEESGGEDDDDDEKDEH